MCHSVDIFNMTLKLEIFINKQTFADAQNGNTIHYDSGGVQTFVVNRMIGVNRYHFV